MWQAFQLRGIVINESAAYFQKDSLKQRGRCESL
jgi:hypothetical protein